jgi:hypothetical protein
VTATKTRARPKNSPVVFPRIKSSEQSATQIVARLARESAAKMRQREAEKWAAVRIDDSRPIGVVWFGDPHLGASTNWQRLRADVRTCATTPGMYGANLGDSSNNWVGRLARIYGDEDISRKTERKLVQWFLADAGVKWLVWLMGNHDEWEHGADIIRLMRGAQCVPMHDWEARLKLKFRGGSEIKIHAAHDFPGSSIYNPTHSNARAVRFLGSDADLYVCGHRHTFGLQQFEVPETGRCPVLVRAAGYKTGDPHARRLGFPEATNGASVLTIFDPCAKVGGRVLAFSDIQQGARVLKALRNGQ